MRINTLNENSIQPLRKSLLRCLSENAQNEDDFLREINFIASKEGDHIFPVLLKLLTHLDFDKSTAKQKWNDILAHQSHLGECLGRPVSLLTSICDYFSSIHKTFQAPKVIELNDFEKTAHTSNCDGLTGLFNRSYFDEALNGELNRARRYGTEFSLLFLDLDDFKSLNDTMGHQAGDMALKGIAELILAEKRAEDVAARYGGEEMVVILPETNKIKSLVIAERIRRKIDEMVIKFNGDRFHITISGGLASYPVDAKDANELVKCADLAMYTAKGTGKNNISLYSKDKRQYLRVDFFGDINAHILGKVPPMDVIGTGKNLSVGGILFHSKNPINIGTKIQLQIPLPDQEGPFVLIGDVVRVEVFESEYEIGVSFLKIASEVKSEITQYLVRQLDATPL